VLVETKKFSYQSFHTSSFYGVPEPLTDRYAQSRSIARVRPRYNGEVLRTKPMAAVPDIDEIGSFENALFFGKGK
jgi:hypothetical protein